MEDMTKVIIDKNDQSKRRLPTWMQSNATTKKEKCVNIGEIYSTSGMRKETRDALSSRLESTSGEFDVALLEKKKGPGNKKKVLKKHTRKPKRGDGSEDSTRHFVRSKRKIEEDIIGMTEDETEFMSGEIDVAQVGKKDPVNKEKVSKKHSRKPNRGDRSEDSICHFVRSKRKNEEDIIGMTVDEAEFMSGEIDVAQVEKKDPENKEKVSKKQTRKPNRGDVSEDSTCNFFRNKRKIEDINGMTEDEAELSIEDLISIAEEFLSADKIKQPIQYVPSKSKSFESNLIPMSSYVTLEGKPNGAIRSCQLLSKCNQTSSLHLNTNQTDEPAGNSSNKLIQSGDVAQDMLELFLGPLLKKAPPQEPDPEITRNTGLNL